MIFYMKETHRNRNISLLPEEKEFYQKYVDDLYSSPCMLFIIHILWFNFKYKLFSSTVSAKIKQNLAINHRYSGGLGKTKVNIVALAKIASEFTPINFTQKAEDVNYRLNCSKIF